MMNLSTVVVLVAVRQLKRHTHSNSSFSFSVFTLSLLATLGAHQKLQSSAAKEDVTLPATAISCTLSALQDQLHLSLSHALISALSHSLNLG